jgi:hypothetical protein
MMFTLSDVKTNNIDTCSINIQTFSQSANALDRYFGRIKQAVGLRAFNDSFGF